MSSFTLVFPMHPHIPSVTLGKGHKDCTIGRDATKVTLHINDTSVSRIHCTIHLKKKSNKAYWPYICDSSSFGTFINNQQIPPNQYVEVNLGDQISLGPGGISFQIQCDDGMDLKTIRTHDRDPWDNDQTIRPGQFTGLPGASPMHQPGAPAQVLYKGPATHQSMSQYPPAQQGGPQVIYQSSPGQPQIVHQQAGVQPQVIHQSANYQHSNQPQIIYQQPGGAGSRPQVVHHQSVSQYPPAQQGGAQVIYQSSPGQPQIIHQQPGVGTSPQVIHQQPGAQPQIIYQPPGAQPSSQQVIYQSTTGQPQIIHQQPGAGSSPQIIHQQPGAQPQIVHQQPGARPGSGIQSHQQAGAQPQIIYQQPGAGTPQMIHQQPGGQPQIIHQQPGGHPQPGARPGSVQVLPQGAMNQSGHPQVVHQQPGGHPQLVHQHSGPQIVQQPHGTQPQGAPVLYQSTTSHQQPGGQHQIIHQQPGAQPHTGYQAHQQPGSHGAPIIYQSSSGQQGNQMYTAGAQQGHHR